MKTHSKIKERTVDAFDSIVLKLASPERIREWSHGEVTKPETMNYRTQRSEKNGLFDEKIFGPEKDFECYCGKYKGIRYKGIVCEKCGVELTRSIVRRERMGHIELCVPVSHIWYLRTLPSRIAQVLGMNAGEVEKVIYFAGYLVTKVNEDEKERLLRELDSEYKNKVKTLQDEKTKEALVELLMGAKTDIEGIQIGRVLDEVAYHKFSLRYGSAFEAGIGAEAVHNIFKTLDVKKLLAELEANVDKASAVDRDKILRRISVVKSLAGASVRPEWMFINALPVIPAGLRPMVALEGGRHATSDVNDLYRRVINRNNRLRKLREISAPDVILRNEKRILQEAVDALIDNSIRHGSTVYAGMGAAQRRPLKSIADNLKGKRGLFRQNLLGKRVDYSGRSVIVVGPNLKLNQCGLPKHMALELFRPFVISELLKREMAFNIRGASRLIDDGIPEVWAILEQIIKDKYVLLNRAPTLHRLSIQAFQPVLTEGNAIQVHPLVCSPFNADFDGDTMAVHVPLSEEAQMEAREIMQSSKNILKPGSGEPTVTNKMLDIVLGAFWMTKHVPGEKGEGMAFCGPDEAIQALNFDKIGYRTTIKVLAPETPKYAEYAGGVFETTVGRILFNNLLSDSYPFVNKEVVQAVMNGIIKDTVNIEGLDKVPDLIDRMKDFGFKYVTKSGVTWSIDDIVIPKEKYEVVDRAKVKSETVTADYNEGLLAEDEKTRKIISIWQDAKAEVETHVSRTLDRNSPVYDMVISGARGSMAQLTQMVGMKGMIQNAQGETIELPITSSFKEGLTPIEYFITTHGVRKGMTDTALNTAKAGYLTRRLFVVAQDIMVTEDDCGTKEGITITHKTASGIAQSYVKSASGRILAKDVINADGTHMFKRGHLLSKDDALKLENDGIVELSVRSPLTCKTDLGICAACYGLDLAKGKMTDLGEAVGTVAAQAIGEPGTQLTMRTFHSGGVAVVGGDITAGLPRVEELFELRAPKHPAMIAKIDGVISEVKEVGRDRIIKIIPDVPAKGKKVSETEYIFHHPRVPTVKANQHVSKGDILTDGHADIDELHKYAGQSAAQEYIINEVKKIYELQGDSLNRKHIEIIVRQMFSRVKIKEAGETPFAVGDYAEAVEVEMENRKVRGRSGIEAKGDRVAMGITEASLSRRSVLSAASFQHTNRILIGASLKAQPDQLYGIMENVIIGRLIPAGTGFKGSPKNQMIQDLQDSYANGDTEEYLNA
jgi:DNA-directed RNA polymerase subunit beta'